MSITRRPALCLHRELVRLHLGALRQIRAIGLYRQLGYVETGRDDAHLFSNADLMARAGE